MNSTGIISSENNGIINHSLIVRPLHDIMYKDIVMHKSSKDYLFNNLIFYQC